MAWRSGAGAAAVLTLGVLASLLVGPEAVSGVSVAQACAEVSCFSTVVASCGSCFPTQAASFCKSPCQPSWGSLDAITCLGQAGNTYWLNNVQSLNVKCGLPPIPNSGSSAGGGLGAVPDSTTAAAPAQSLPVQVSTAPAESLSGSGSSPAFGTAAAATPVAATAIGSGASTATVGVGTSVTPVSTGAASVATPDTSAAAADTSASAAVVTTPGGTVSQTISITGGAGSTGTAIDTQGAVSSAIATFGCATNAPKLNMAVASGCVTSVAESNSCTQSCQGQFALFTEPCRNLMAADSFYGKTWAALFKTCSIAYDPNGQKVVDTAADLSGGTVVTTAAATQASSTGNQPLLDAVAPSAADMQSATSSMALSAIPLLSAAAALLLLA